jgi:hypothetical protein
MRKFAWCLVVVLLGGVLMAVPASAAFAAIVGLPASTVYSPYGGPVAVTFTFASDDPATIFVVRIRQPGHGALETKNVLVDPAIQTSPQQVDFSWATMSVSAPTDYTIDVRRQDDNALVTSETFTLLPKLVSGLSATPSPFYPLIQDGYKDQTKIGFSLAADATDAVVHVFNDDVYGRCCGSEIRSENLGPLGAGAHTWVWDGLKGNASAAPKGTYFVKVEATDLAATTAVSKAQKVVVTKGMIRRTSTKTKQGRAYARVGDAQDTALGGNCFVSKNATTHAADITCANAKISVYWNWGLKPGERIESVSFVIDGGVWGCHKTLDHTRTQSILRVHSPPASTCRVMSAKIAYSYRVPA